MKRIAWSFAALICALAGCSTPQSSQSRDEVSFYQVQLICPAVPQIGCGSAAKPMLLELERQPAIAEAWLNRAGTVIAVVWKEKESAKKRLRVIEKAAEGAEAKQISEKTAQPLRVQFASGRGWYRGAAVDRLSVEEAGIIAARLVRRTHAQAPLAKETAAALEQSLAELAKRRFLSQEPISMETTVAEARQRAKELLTTEQFAAFEQSIAAGLRPLPNEL